MAEHYRSLSLTLKLYSLFNLEEFLDAFLFELLTELNDVLQDLEFDYAGTDSVPYQKLKDIIETIEEKLND